MGEAVRDRIPCRLCGAPSSFRFTLTVMNTYEVAYYECSGCRSLQTEQPYWLDQAYAAQDRTVDIGRAQRNVLYSVLCAYILEHLGVRNEDPCLDWGAAEGLYGRLMRDRGFNFFCYDKYCRPLYVSEHFTAGEPTAMAPVVVTAIDVFEHFAEPAQELTRLFSLKPRIVLFTQEWYDEQKDDWWYLAPFCGQHVFFYSQTGLEAIANRFGYRYAALSSLHAFVKDEAWGDPVLDGFHGRLQRLMAAKDTINQNAALGFVDHLMGNPWKFVQDDSLFLKTNRACNIVR